MTKELPRFSLPVLAAEVVAHRQILLRLDARGTDVPRSHTRVGQYAFLRRPDEPRARPLVLASLPGSEVVEVLLKVDDERERNAWLERAAERVELSVADGHGYPLHKAEGRPLYLLAVGSAIAALRPVVESVLAVRDRYGPVHLLYGVRHPEDFAFASDFPRWERGLGRLTLVVSRPAGSPWAGATGYVQDHLPDPLPDAERAVAFVCGLPEMEQDVYSAFEARGVLEDRVFRNYG